MCSECYVNRINQQFTIEADENFGGDGWMGIWNVRKKSMQIHNKMCGDLKCSSPEGPEKWMGGDWV